MKGIRQFFKSIDVAFSIYSKIPMPRFNWGTEDMKYHLCFFPWIGLVIGALEWGWYDLCTWQEWNRGLLVLIAMAIPLLVTGGFHVDGFMDTMDALHSYQDKEKKLEILKDPHIGAFAVICLATYLILAGGLAFALTDTVCVQAVLVAFFMARALSGVSVIYFPSAKRDGMMKMEGNTAQKTVVGISLMVQLLVGVGLLVLISWKVAVVQLATGIVVYLYYYLMSRKQFGGITGDLCGYFVTVYELAMLMAAGICNLTGWF